MRKNAWLRILGLCAFTLLTVAGSPPTALGQSVGPAEAPLSLAAPLQLPPPRRMVEGTEAALMASLRPATVAALDQLEAVRTWNAEGRRPAKNGFARPLPLPRLVALHPRFASDAPAEHAGGMVARSADGGLIWATRVVVEEAYRLRLHLDQVDLPAGTRLWVYNDRESVGPFGLELMSPEGDLWTPSLSGPELRLEVVLPATPAAARGVFGFVLDRVMELVSLEPAISAASVVGLGAPGQDASCLIDGTCVGTDVLGIIDDYRRAVAQLDFIRDGQNFVCTGGLLRDTENTGNPYLLTANHCFSTQASAASLEALWDYVPDTCLGPFPDPADLPHSNGATLLATSVQTDFTLVRLNGLPPNRFFLGWTLDPIIPDTVLYRLSHPAPTAFGFPLVQTYSQSRFVSGPASCGTDKDGRPLGDPSKFLRSRRLILNGGGTFGGSSGAPAINANGQVVGQLFGACGFGADDGCSPFPDEVDGAFRSTYPSISQFLDPPSGPPSTEPCVPNATTLCLSDDRFEVKVNWETKTGGMGAGNAFELTPDTGYFWFFNESNVEMVIKVLNVCSFAKRVWVFAGGLTDVQTTIEVRDTQSGITKTYINPQGTAFQPIQDTSAFSTCP